MRDDQAVPGDRDTTDRTNTVSGRREQASSSDRADDASVDSPTPLSAIAHPADVEEVGLSDDEIAIYRRRVADGLYNSREVADEVARRMMRRGDI
jgi:hypothetical protein